jgi:hypothetical protein
VIEQRIILAKLIDGRECMDRREKKEYYCSKNKESFLKIFDLI